jgi:hypothetical protein
VYLLAYEPQTVRGDLNLGERHVLYVETYRESASQLIGSHIPQRDQDLTEPPTVRLLDLERFFQLFLGD